MGRGKKKKSSAVPQASPLFPPVQAHSANPNRSGCARAGVHVAPLVPLFQKGAAPGEERKQQICKRTNE